MLARIRKAAEEKDQGFTLIELLVVMIIIGILAAIAIPVFLNQRKNGYRTSLKSDLKNAATGFESAAVDQGGDYTKVFPGAFSPKVLPDTTKLVEFKNTAGDTVTLQKVSATNYCISAVNGPLGAEVWSYTKSDGVPTKVACPATLP